MVLFQPPADPFPDPTHAGQEIEFIGIIFFTILVLIIMIILMMYFYLKVKRLLPILIIFLFSLLIGMYSLTTTGFPFTPWFQIFFIVFQSVIFYMCIDEGARF